MNKQDAFLILAINPGSTSTKVAVYRDEELLVSKTVQHSKAQLDKFGDVHKQEKMRLACVLQVLEDSGISPQDLSAVVGRGGLVEPIDSGTYVVNQRMIDDLLDAHGTVHASAFGGIIAYEIAQANHIPSYVVDPIVVDELDQNAKLTGMPGLERRSVFHALNQKSVARRCAADMGLDYENGRFVVAHMGGGVTVGAHRYGRVIDVNDALAGEGPFTPERTGALPAVPLIHLCFSGDYTEQELVDKVTRAGGLTAYLGTNDLRKVERLIKEGDEYATLVLESMAYQVCKEIGAMYAVLEGRADAIILTGGLAHSTRFTGCIKQRIGQMAPIKVYPGEDEMLALASGALRVLRGKEPAMDY